MKAIIQTPTPSIEKSEQFYTKLGFTKIPQKDSSIYSDGKAIIEINKDRFARAGIKIYKNDWGDEIIQIQQHTSVTKSKNGYLLCDPSGMWIYLIDGESPVNYNVGNIETSILGNYAGLSLETSDINKSMTIWSTLGFSKTMGSVDQGWVCCANEDKFNLSFMKPFSCPHLFFNPSLSYFNGKNNIGIINKIRSLRIPITEEITYFNKDGIVDNIIIRDPGGFGFFIFND